MKRLIAILFFCLSNFYVFSQATYKAEPFKAALMQTKTGAMVVYNGKKHSFTIDIISDSIKPSKHPNFVIVDNKVLQASIISFQSKLDFDNLDEEAQIKNLLGYMNYELDYVKNQLKSKDLNEKYEFIKLNDKIFIFWTYDMPKSNESIDKQCYLVTICFDQMLILNTPLTKGKQSYYTESFDKLKEFLLSIGKTLKLNNYSIDLNKLYNDLNKK